MHFFTKSIYVLLVCFSLFTALSVKAQESKKKNFNKQITIAEENDLLAFKGTDGYYTNGLFINYSLLKKNNKRGTLKSIYNFEIGQKIFTPGIREVYVVTEIDRPITGYLYGKYSVEKFKINNKLWSYGLSLGIIGEMSQGKRLLDLFHPIIKINSDWWDWMWKYQLKNEAGLNAHASYAFSIINNKVSDHIQITPVSTLTLGTTFSNIAQSLVFQFGKQNKMSESEYWNSRVSNEEISQDKSEFFFFFQPKVQYQLYNATVQGGMLRQDKGGITSEIKPVVFYNEFGIMYSKNRYSASFHLTFQTKEAKIQEKNHAYGGIQLSYRFN